MKLDSIAIRPSTMLLVSLGFGLVGLILSLASEMHYSLENLTLGFLFDVAVVLLLLGMARAAVRHPREGWKRVILSAAALGVAWGVYSFLGGLSFSVVEAYSIIRVSLLYGGLAATVARLVVWVVDGFVRPSSPGA
ncbi:MAG: hypothetical protein O7H41_15985 [Planctomycetota bacterium]|nr:hypothetical protein [Planctomycetota bacterium]